jgi:hypothetical protein
MTRKNFNVLIITGSICLLLAAAFFVFRPLPLIFPTKDRETRQTRIIIPREPGNGSGDSSGEFMSYEESVRTRVSMDEGEVVVAVLTQDFNGDAGMSLPRLQGRELFPFIPRIWSATGEFALF